MHHMPRPNTLWLLSGLLAFLCAGSAPAQDVSLQSLLGEMTSREALARFPSPAYICRQASSYDRDSVSPDDPATWYANWDRSQFVRTEKYQGRTEQLRDAQELIATTNRRLAADRSDDAWPKDASDWAVTTAAGELPAGESSEPMILTGPGAIRSLQCRLVADDLQQALRSTVVEIVFDGEPSVWCPIGDFFGIGHQLRPQQTWYTHVRPDGLMSCTWVMPYQKQAVVTLHNLAAQPVE